MALSAAVRSRVARGLLSPAAVADLACNTSGLLVKQEGAVSLLHRLVVRVECLIALLRLADDERASMMASKPHARLHSFGHSGAFRAAAESSQVVVEKDWSGRRGSNPRHQAWEACVLPLNYSRFAFDSISRWG
jgi:hypothetical protein